MKILVGLSGGVDSTVSAYLLQKMGYEVEGVYMKLHNLVDNYHEKNIENVKKVANFLGIKYHIVDFSDDFKKLVYDYFINDYKNALTPNPCVVCNRFIKFGKMYEFANSLGIQKIATGHYARIKDNFIYKGMDENKDQSYFISWIDKDILKNIIFPLGEMQKSEVKEIAKDIEVLKDIATAKESNEICFVENTYMDLLKKHFDIDKDGNVINTNGEIIGKHKGYMHYTIGKRKGFEVTKKGPDAKPSYITNINADTNTITVAPKEELFSRYFEAKDLNMFIDEKSFECSVKVRYRTTPASCKVEIIDNIAKVNIKEDVFGIAKGQSAVFYDDEKVIGSGFIL